MRYFLEKFALEFSRRWPEAERKQWSPLSRAGGCRALSIRSGGEGRGIKKQRTPGHQMSRQIFLLVPALTFFFAAALANAEKRPAQTESFATFWAGFKSAVAKNDKEAVVAATHLPSFQLSKAAFLKAYSSIFTRQVKKCFASAKPVRDRDSYSVFCGEEYYFFEKVNGAYKLTDIGMND